MSRPFWEPGYPCKGCGKEVFYTAGRRRCRACKAWLHEPCSFVAGPPNTGSLCEECLRERPIPTIRYLSREISEEKRRWPALEMLLWSGLFGQDEDEISLKLDIPRAKVAEIAGRLRAQEIWLPGGRLNMDVDPSSASPGEMAINYVMLALAGDGMIERSRVDAAAPPVPGSGGNENAQ